MEPIKNKGECIEEGRSIRHTVRQATAQAGRDPEEIKFVAFVGYTIGDTERQALNARRALDDQIDVHGQLSRLSAYLGLYEELALPDEQPLTAAQLASVRAHPNDARSVRAVELAKAGWSPRDILAHGVFDPNPYVAGTAEQIADHLQEWFEAEAVDGFVTSFDDFHTGIGGFVDRVVPILRERGLFPDGYEGRPSVTTWACQRSTDSTPHRNWTSRRNPLTDQKIICSKELIDR